MNEVVPIGMDRLIVAFGVITLSAIFLAWLGIRIAQARRQRALSRNGQPDQ